MPAPLHRPVPLRTKQKRKAHLLQDINTVFPQHMKIKQKYYKRCCIKPQNALPSLPCAQEGTLSNTKVNIYNQ